MPEVVTITERKAREAARRRAAIAEVMADLRRYGAEHGGRFLIFGSAAEDRIGPDSDLDVVVDFPAGAETPAIEHVEDICKQHRIPVDVLAKSATKTAFLDRIGSRSLVIP